MKHRPEGWEKFKKSNYFMEIDEEIFEAGADAMLEGLKKGGYILGESLVNTKSVGWQNINPKSKWYCIPDEES